MPRKDITEWPEKTMMIKRIYDIDKNIVNEARRNYILGLVLEGLLNQSVYSSKSVTSGG